MGLLFSGILEEGSFLFQYFDFKKIVRGSNQEIYHMEKMKNHGLHPYIQNQPLKIFKKMPQG